MKKPLIGYKVNNESIYEKDYMKHAYSFASENNYTIEPCYALIDSEFTILSWQWIEQCNATFYNSYDEMMLAFEEQFQTIIV